MSNSYFQFKQFIVQQDRAAMKVCTDSCLFGAWVASKAKVEDLKPERILDIGAGTGLLSLMLAQNTDATIDAVEIDEAAAEQATENFGNSPWKERLHLLTGDITTLTLSHTYDLIISNPPFFNNDLKSTHRKRNFALHDDELTFEELLDVATRLLNNDGSFAVLLPFHRSDFFIDAAVKKRLSLREQILVKQTEKHTWFRSMLLFTRKQNETKKSEIVIKQNDKYSEAFVALLEDYYLYL